jgi:hypothetical protein
VWKVAACCMKTGCEFPNDIAATKCKACGRETFASPDIVWSEVESLTRRQKEVMDGGAPELISKVIKRKEMDGGAEHVYDLADRLIQEFVPFPFAPHDDLLDWCSRVYDMGAIVAAGSKSTTSLAYILIREGCACYHGGRTTLFIPAPSTAGNILSTWTTGNVTWLAVSSAGLPKDASSKPSRLPSPVKPSRIPDMDFEKLSRPDGVS